MERALRAATALCAGLAASPAAAQRADEPAASRPPFRVAPSVSVTQAWSDNVALSPEALAQPGWITGIAPAIRAELEGTRMKAFVDYRFLATWYAGTKELDSTQRFLNASAHVEAWEDRAFVEARADITQQNRSPLGPAVTQGVAVPGANRVETTSWQAAPYVRGDLSDIATYRLRFEETRVRADDIVLPPTAMSALKGRIGSPSAFVKLGWAVDVKALRMRNDVAGTLDDAHLRASAIYAVNPQLRVSVSEGYEASDFAGPPRRRADTPGVGFDFMPGVRTRLSALYEKRFFGDGHRVVFSHRTPLTAWRITSSKDATVLPAQLAGGDAGSVSSLMYDLLASAIPDREERAQAVRRRLEQSGISDDSALTSSVLFARPFVSSSATASVTLLGAINTATLTAVRKQQRGFGVRISGSGGVDEDFRQAGVHANLAHKLTPFTTLTLASTWLRTESLEVASRRSTQRNFDVVLSTRLGPRTSASLGVRSSVFASSEELASYRENAVFASVSIRM